MSCCESNGQSSVPVSLQRPGRFGRKTPWRLAAHYFWIVLYGTISVFAADNAEDAKKPLDLVRIITVNSPIGDDTLGQVRRTLLETEDLAVRENRHAYVILEIHPGTSPFHNCYALADFLTEKPFDNTTTVAWIPETVTGNNVLVALACQNIVMSPSASLGDMGNGKAVPEDQQAIVKSIVNRRRNVRVTPALAAAMMDPACHWSSSPSKRPPARRKASWPPKMKPAHCNNGEP